MGEGRCRVLGRNALHVFALTGLAIAQPLFDLVETDPAALVYGEATGGALVVFAVAIVLIPLLVIMAVEAIAALAGQRALRDVHLATIAGLVALFVLQARTALGWLPDETTLLAGMAGVAGLTAAWVYERSPAVRSGLSLLAAAPLAFLVVFLALGPASPLVRASEAEVTPPRIAGSPPSLVLIALDELPLSSLLNGRGEIDAQRFPAFARLAGESTWFRNTTSVEAFTAWALPAMLEGKSPEPRGYSHAAFHPRTLFTLLGGRYRLHVEEPITSLCPRRLCPRDNGGALGRGFAAFDPLVHPFWSRLLPGQAGQRAAEVTQWIRGRLGARASTPFDVHEFAGAYAVRERVFDRFRATLRPGREPTLHFLHTLFPHGPFVFQRRRQYSLPGPGTEEGLSLLWPDDQGVTDLGWRRHMLQLEYTDRQLGLILDRMDATGLSDRAVLAVIADHGAYFAAGVNRREPTAVTLPSLAPVPFFVRAPGGGRPAVVDHPVETIDLLPTLAETLGVRLPWKIDGVSAWRGRPGDTPVRMTDQARSPVTVPRSRVDRGLPVLRQRIPVTGQGADRRQLFAARGFASLVDDRVPKRIPADPRLSAHLRPGRADRAEPPIAWVGTLAGGSGTRVVAIALCGRVRAVARTYRVDETERLAAVVDERTARACPPELLLVEGDARSPRLARRVRVMALP